MNGRDLHRIATNPRAAMDLLSGNMGAVQRFLDERNREDKIDEAIDTKQWESQLRTGVADVIDLRIEVNPAKSTTQPKPD